MASPSNTQNWNIFKWTVGVVLGVLFTFGAIVQVNQSTTAVEEDHSIVSVEVSDPANAGLSDDEIFAKGTALLGSNNPADRIKGLDAMHSADPARASATVVQRLGDPHESVRIRAAEIIAHQKGVGAGRRLAALLIDPSANVRNKAAALTVKFAAEPGIASSLVSPLTSQDITYVRPAITVWKAVLEKDRAGAVQAIQPGLSAVNEEILAEVLGAITPLTGEELRTLVPLLEGIKSRLPETRVAAQAQSLIGRANG